MFIIRDPNDAYFDLDVVPDPEAEYLLLEAGWDQPNGDPDGPRDEEWDDRNDYPRNWRD